MQKQGRRVETNYLNTYTRLSIPRILDMSVLMLLGFPRFTSDT